MSEPRRHAPLDEYCGDGEWAQRNEEPMSEREGVKLDEAGILVRLLAIGAPHYESDWTIFERQLLREDIPALLDALASERARADAYREALEKINKHRCPFRSDGGCVESWKLAMGGKIPKDEQERRYSPACIARAAIARGEKENR
jgi:hypothetical protein